MSAGELKNYEVDLGNGQTATFRLTEADAKKRGLAGGKTAAKAQAPQNKARRASNKAAKADAEAGE